MKGDSPMECGKVWKVSPAAELNLQSGRSSKENFTLIPSRAVDSGGHRCSMFLDDMWWAR